MSKFHVLLVSGLFAVLGTGVTSFSQDTVGLKQVAGGITPPVD